MKKLQLKVINPVPNIDLLAVALITQGYQFKKWKKYLPFYLKENYSTFKKDFLHWYNDFTFWKKFGKAAFDKVARDKNFAKLIYKEHKRIGRLLYDIGDKVLEKDISKLSNQQIYNYLKKIFSYFSEICFWGIIPPVIDFENYYLSDYLESQTTESVKKYHLKKSAQEIFSLLTTPNELIFAQKENIDLLKLAAKKEVKESDIIKHYKRYRWLDYGYFGPAKSLSYFNKQLNALRKSRKKASQELKVTLNRFKKIRSEQKEYSKKLQLNPHTKYLFRVAKTFMFLKVYRQELEFKAIYAYDLLFKEIEKRFGYSVKQLHYCMPRDILGIFKGKKPDKKELNKRINSFFTCVFTPEKTSFYYGDKAKSIFKGKLYKEKIDKSIKEIKGMTAFSGKAKGVVKIINIASEMKKIKKGDILVSIATNPTIIPAMKKASAFVTDMGGVTCHAAIVSRELEIPCITGTKIATKVLKDGDRVEVDATAGIVKKI